MRSSGAGGEGWRGVKRPLVVVDKERRDEFPSHSPAGAPRLSQQGRRPSGQGNITGQTENPVSRVHAAEP